MTIADVDQPLTDAELTTLALSLERDAPLAADAVPLSFGEGTALLPSWYMAAPTAHGGSRTRRWVLAGLVGAMIAVNGASLCVTYGFPEIAW